MLRAAQWKLVQGAEFMCSCVYVAGCRGGVAGRTSELHTLCFTVVWFPAGIVKVNGQSEPYMWLTTYHLLVVCSKARLNLLELPALPMGHGVRSDWSSCLPKLSTPATGTISRGLHVVRGRALSVRHGCRRGFANCHYALPSYCLVALT